MGFECVVSRTKPSSFTGCTGHCQHYLSPANAFSKTRPLAPQRSRLKGAGRVRSAPSEDAAGASADNPLEGIKLNEEGDLVDAATGKVVNDLGATRFDVVLSTLRGEMGGKYGAESTEQKSGQILDALVRFPAPYTFQIVGKNAEGFVGDMITCVQGHCPEPILEENIVQKERKGGKYLSISITAMVETADTVQHIFDEIGKDARVMMKY